MQKLNYLHVINGEELERTTCDLRDKEVIFEKPKEITISIFRNDEREKDRFEIQIIPPKGYVHTISCYDNERQAKAEFEKLIKEIETGQKKIKISMTKGLSVSIC